MAFSTQSNLQKNSVLTKKYKNLMKTYGSCTDTRAYALKDDQRNKYLLERLCGDADSARGSSNQEINTERLTQASTSGDTENQDKERFRIKIQELTEQNESLKREVLNLRKKPSSILESYSNVIQKKSSESLKNMKKTIEELENKLRAATALNEDLNKKVSDLSQDNSNEKLLKTIQELENQLQSSTKVNEDFKKEVTDLRKNLVESDTNANVNQKNSNEKLKKATQELENKLKSSIELNEDLKKELSTLRKNPESNSKLENELKQKNEMLEKSDAENNALKSKLREMENGIKKMQGSEDRFHNLRVENDALQKLNENREAEIDELKNFCRTVKDSTEAYKQELKLYRANYAKLEEERNCIIERCHSLQQEKDLLKNGNHGLAQDLVQAKAEITKFTNEIDQIKGYSYSNSEEKNCCIKCEERFATLIDLQKELKETQEQIMSAIEDSVLDEAVKRGISDHHSHNLVETVNYTLSHVSEEFEKRKSLENELDDLKDQITHNSDENLNLIEELKGGLAVRNEEIRVLKGQLDDLEERLQSEKQKYKTDLEQLNQEIYQLEKVKESNESLKQQIVQLESSEYYENQLEKEVQTEDEESREELLKKIEELVEANEKLQEENQKLNKKAKSDSVSLKRLSSANYKTEGSDTSLRHLSSASSHLNKEIEELIEVNQKLEEENQRLKAESLSNKSQITSKQLSSEMYKTLECKHRETIRDLQKAHEKEKQDLLKDCGKEQPTQPFSGVTRKAFTKLDHFCSIVLSDGLKNFSCIDLQYFHDIINEAAVLFHFKNLCEIKTPNLRTDLRQTKCPEKHFPPKKLNNDENNLRIKLCDERKNQKMNIESKSKAQMNLKKNEKYRLSNPPRFK